MPSARHDVPARDLIDAIVPVDLGRRPVSLLRRLARLFALGDATGCRFVLGHHDRGTLHDVALRALCARYGVRRAAGGAGRGEVNNARLRNHAMALATSDVVLLLDADLHIDRAVLDAAVARVRSGDEPFAILPCLYLSRQGTADFLAGRSSAAELWADFLRFRRAPFLHLALPSSVVFLRREDYARVGSFDEGFEGHGYEDFDFLLRLAWAYDAMPRTKAAIFDGPARAPLLATGFRAHLARLALAPALRGEVALHLFHEVGKDSYRQMRPTNRARFEEKLGAMAAGEGEGSASTDLDLDLIAAFRAECRRQGLAPRSFSILFDDRPGHVDRLDTVGRRWRFLIGRT